MLKVNKEMDGNTPFFTISGTDGKREYYRIGHFLSVDSAREEIKSLIGNKVERGIISDVDHMQNIQV